MENKAPKIDRRYAAGACSLLRLLGRQGEKQVMNELELQAARDAGYDPACGSCMALYFTGT